MNDDKPLVNPFAMPAKFSIHEVIDPAMKARAKTALPVARAAPKVELPAPLGPLSAFAGTYAGNGFNTIFRPESAVTPTALPTPANTTDPADNLLELNLTEETLSFSPNLKNVPNRGSNNQGDINLNAAPYVQSINDVTSGDSTGIHFEPGMWLVAPATTNPKEPVTVARMASIPHGTTIVAQGLALPAVAGPPTIGVVGITPLLGGVGGAPFRFQNQTVTNNTTRRLPQDLTALSAAALITQNLLDNPNQMLADRILGQNITKTIEVRISTNPASPLPSGPFPAGFVLGAPNFGGGTSNIAFLLGEAAPAPGGPNSNANAFQMDAIFWIETVVYDVAVPPIPPGTPGFTLGPVQTMKAPFPTFLAEIPFVDGMGFAGGTVQVETVQIQYSQKVMLDFNGLSWPHVSVATLVPAAPVRIPAHLLPLT